MRTATGSRLGFLFFFVLVCIYLWALPGLFRLWRHWVRFKLHFFLPRIDVTVVPGFTTLVGTLARLCTEVAGSLSTHDTVVLLSSVAAAFRRCVCVCVPMVDLYVGIRSVS